MLLPQPDGAYRVGSSSCWLTDAERPARLLSEEVGRQIFCKVWYPADVQSRLQPERLWAQLRSDPTLPSLMKFVLPYFTRIRTNTIGDAAFLKRAIDETGCPIVLYSHGLISFASENTTLMECLASHGAIVVAIQHKSQLAELTALNQAQPPEERKAHAALQKRILRASGEERARLSREFFRAATNTNRIVAERARDTQYVMDHIQDVLRTIPELHSAHLKRTDTFALCGLSLGGAVSTEVAKQDKRARCVVNIDGGHYGMRQEQAVEVPYLMLYSEANFGSNATALVAGRRDVVTTMVLPHTKHLNLHDIALIAPWLRWLGITGNAGSHDTTRSRNRSVQSFIASAAAGS